MIGIISNVSIVCLEEYVMSPILLPLNLPFWASVYLHVHSRWTAGLATTPTPTPWASSTSPGNDRTSTIKGRHFLERENLLTSDIVRKGKGGPSHVQSFKWTIRLIQICIFYVFTWIRGTYRWTKSAKLKIISRGRRFQRLDNVQSLSVLFKECSGWERRTAPPT